MAFILTVQSYDTNPFSISAYTIEVLNVEPYPIFSIIVEPEDINIKLKVTKD